MEDKLVSLNTVLSEIDRWIGYLDEDMIMRIQTGIKKLPSVTQLCDDMISRGVFEQVMWERDVAIEQLKDLGYRLGEKPKTGHWIPYKNEADVYKCTACEAIVYEYPTSWDYCPWCGVRMVESRK